MSSRVSRLLSSGLACGLVWALLGGFLVGLVGADFLAAASRAERVAMPAGDRVLLFAITVGGGFWAMWIYAIVRESAGPGIKSSALVGTAWWVITGIQSAKWMIVGGVTAPSAIALGLAVLPAMIAATAVGAWLYERGERAPLVSSA